MKKVDAKGLGDDARRAILERVKAKLGFNEAAKALKIAKGSLAFSLIESFKSNEIIEINRLDVDTPRLVRFEEKGFCRCYMGLRKSAKPCKWAYFSVETLKLLEKHANKRVDQRALQRYVERRGLLLLKYVFKSAWRLMIRAMPREAARFVQSRFGELKVSEAGYEDLLAEADEHYPKCLKQINGLMNVRAH